MTTTATRAFRWGGLAVALATGAILLLLARVPAPAWSLPVRASLAISTSGTTRFAGEALLQWTMLAGAGAWALGEARAYDERRAAREARSS